MPRIAVARAPAVPSSPQQWSRHTRIVGAAARQADLKGYDRVQMAEVAAEAEVALGTLYRYFPSKVHLFTAVMRDRLDRYAEASTGRAPATADPVVVVTDLLVDASRRLLAHPQLTRAMLQANNTAHAESVTDVSRVDQEFGLWLFAAVGRSDPTPEDLQLVRLLEQAYWGVLTRALNGRLTTTDAQSDIERACALLLAPWAGI